MATDQSAGTEIIRSILWDALDDYPLGSLVIGEQHHIYTILSITIYCQTADSTTANNRWTATLTGWSGRDSQTASAIIVFKTPELKVGDTYVWNDKFSFNGTEPTGLSGDYTDATEQTAVAAQGSTTSQLFKIAGGSSTCKADVTCTFIDQNNV